MSSVLFSPIALRGLTLKNRIAVSPMCQYICDDGNANDWHLMHYGSLALGAGGLLTFEMTNVSPSGRISQKCATLCSDENEASWKRVVELCKKFGGAAIGIELAHAGRKASTVPPAQGGRALKPEEGAWETVAPSALPYADWHTPRALAKGDLVTLVDEFVASTQRAHRAGFELIEFHAGHGYLMHQFLSALSNQRTDEYGGSVENRMRFPLQVFAAMREAWPKDKPLGVRLSVTDWVEGGLDMSQSLLFAHQLKKLGCDFVDVSSGGLDHRQQVPFAPGYHVGFAEQMKREVGMTTMVVGLVTGPKQAEEIVASGKADMVVMGRGVLYNPRWSWHAAEELGVDIPYVPKMFPAHPSLRPAVFPNRAKA
ncbi:MAG: NADH:flavin oxidoreductase/NADH oxidase [Ramlibacter sp.]|nr:NADH:flavin oxidoreductase/NADH oxidase [Ramlibacter sp.]